MIEDFREATDQNDVWLDVTVLTPSTSRAGSFRNQSPLDRRNPPRSSGEWRRVAWTDQMDANWRRIWYH
jgi:hypothetical protein